MIDTTGPIREVEEQKTRVRSGAHSTELQAAEAVYPRSGTQRRRVLDFLKDRGSEGATDMEIEAALGIARSSASTRRKELQEAGYVVDSGKTRKTRFGLNAKVWIARRPAGEQLSLLRTSGPEGGS